MARVDRLDELPANPHPVIDDWLDWLFAKNFYPTAFITLTFDRQKCAASVEGALWWWRRLVQHLNTRMANSDYRDKWGHSYFGYVVAVEYHKSGAVHLHAAVDNWIDFAEVHSWWGERCGFAWIKKTQNSTAAMRYVLKYVVKSDQAPTVWLQRRRRSVDTLTLPGAFVKEPPASGSGHGQRRAVKVAASGPEQLPLGLALTGRQDMPGS